MPGTWPQPSPPDSGVGKGMGGHESVLDEPAISSGRPRSRIEALNPDRQSAGRGHSKS